MITTKSEATYMWCLLTNSASEPGMVNVIGTQGCKRLAEGALAYFERETASPMVQQAIGELNTYIKNVA